MKLCIDSTRRLTVGSFNDHVKTAVCAQLEKLRDKIERLEPVSPAMITTPSIHPDAKALIHFSAEFLRTFEGAGIPPHVAFDEYFAAYLDVYLRHNYNTSLED
jgi:predicted membrane GTPase involved in stress response